MLEKIIKIILIVAWMGLIFMFSNDTAVESSKKSDGFIIKTVQVVLGRKLEDKEKKQYIKYLVVPVRKMAHALVYLVLGILVSSLLGVDDKKKVLYAVLFTFLYASFDEIHQAFVPGRSCEVRDVLIDTLGAFIGCFNYYIIKRRKP